ncbi:MAG: Por secretion system protein [Prevotella sp.]|nr:Por secretion system protein [Prevotella sp.]
MRALTLLITYHLSVIVSVAQIGTWRNYLAYHDVEQIQEASGDNIFVLASGDLYQYNTVDHSIVTYDKVSGLSDTDISHIRWCQQAKRLIAVYSNSNIDLVDANGNIVNISDIYSKAITGDKTINSVYVNSQYAYLACGFGIVKVNMKDAEISESYMFYHNISNVAISGNTIYAKVTETYTTQPTAEDFIIPYHGDISISKLWQSRTLTYYIKAPLSSNLIDKYNWEIVTDDLSSLFVTDNADYDKYIETVKTLQPGGPKHNYFGFLKFTNKKLYSCGGGFYTPATIQVLKDGEWEIYKTENDDETLPGALCLDAEQQADGDHVFVGARNGLYEYMNGSVVNYYDYHNSPIERFDGVTDGYQLITGVKLDGSGNLWLLNSQAPTQALIKYSNGTFTSLSQSALMKLNDGAYTNKSNGKLSNIIFDSKGLMWFCNDHWIHPALYQYDTERDNIKAYETFINQDGTTLSEMSAVRCVAEDLESNIWIGTPAGPLMLERDQINTNGTVFTQVKVPRNDGTNYADYLLTGIDITAIAIDGGNRKWFGTNGNGVYLISADNMTQLQHFTTSNSKLLSSIITAISIDNSTGEVFFGTDKGLCSYVSDATETNEEMTEDNVWAYPNPVTPDYTGLITITGLSFDADVKILSANGALVAEGRSNGGTFTWDGCDQKGRRVASGVYMVATATSSGKKGTVCKIAIVR